MSYLHLARLSSKNTDSESSAKGTTRVLCQKSGVSESGVKPWLGMSFMIN
jgi:hypothetical protein